MKKLRKTKFNYNILTDVRKDELKFGRYLYLLILTIVIIVIIHVLFSHWYLMKGNGFVYSKHITIESEFKATVVQVYVENGQRVNVGQPLYSYNSIELKKLKQEFEDKITQTKLEIKSVDENINLIEKNIKSFKKYFMFTQDFADTLEKKKGTGIVHLFQISGELKREFEARKSILELEREKLSMQLKRNNYAVILKETEKRKKSLLEFYQDGVVHSSLAGVIVDMRIVPGTVLEVGDRAMNIFYGKRFILGYLNPKTWVDYKIGDNVLVNIPQRDKYISGRIDKLLPITEKIPEEFQPRFSSKLRHQVYLIDTQDDNLSDVPILTTVTINRLLLHDFFVSLRKKIEKFLNLGVSNA